MICPQCKGEYREGFTKCARCGVDLIETLAKPSKPQTEGWNWERWLIISVAISAGAAITGLSRYTVIGLIVVGIGLFIMAREWIRND